MGYFLLFLFIFFFVLPWVLQLLAKIALYFLRRRARKAFEKMYEQTAGNFRQGSGYTQGSRNPGHGTSKSKRKKIASDVGEYVRFEEVDITIDKTSTSNPSSNDSSSTQRIETEQQIIDVEWEDLP